jgi:hypothetical protein
MWKSKNRRRETSPANEAVASNRRAIMYLRVLLREGVIDSTWGVSTVGMMGSIIGVLLMNIERLASVDVDERGSFKWEESLEEVLDEEFFWGEEVRLRVKKGSYVLLREREEFFWGFEVVVAVLLVLVEKLFRRERVNDWCLENISEEREEDDRMRGLQEVMVHFLKDNLKGTWEEGILLNMRTIRWKREGERGQTKKKDYITYIERRIDSCSQK